MIGGGFGGSVLALVPGIAVPAVESAVRGAFKERSWAQPGFRPAAASEGARRLGLQ